MDSTATETSTNDDESFLDIVRCCTFLVFRLLNCVFSIRRAIAFGSDSLNARLLSRSLRAFWSVCKVYSQERANHLVKNFLVILVWPVVFLIFWSCQSLTWGEFILTLESLRRGKCTPICWVWEAWRMARAKKQLFCNMHCTVWVILYVAFASHSLFHSSLISWRQSDTIDGIPSQNLHAALSSFQRSRDMPETGEPVRLVHVVALCLSCSSCLETGSAHPGRTFQQRGVSRTPFFRTA